MVTVTEVLVLVVVSVVIVTDIGVAFIITGQSEPGRTVQENTQTQQYISLHNRSSDHR